MEDDWDMLDGNARAWFSRARTHASGKSKGVQTKPAGRVIKLAFRTAAGGRPKKTVNSRRASSSSSGSCFTKIARALTATGPTIHIGSDCTGVNTTHIAMELLGLHVVDEFASELDDKARLVIEHNFNVNRMSANIFQRDDGRLPSIDLYTAGAPCQSFSTEGLQGGLKDCRGKVFLRVLTCIETVHPKTFILENVQGLKTRHKHVYDYVLRYLQHIADETGSKLYHVRVKLLNTCVHGGLPQARPRLYIVGWKRKEEKSAFVWPSEIPMKPLCKILDKSTGDPSSLSTSGVGNLHKALKKITASGGNPLCQTYIINVASGSRHGGGHSMKGCCPCLTRARCAGGGHWISTQQRMMLRVELERLQGFPPGRLQLPPGVTEKQYTAMLGNAFTVSVVGRVSLALLQCVGIVDNTTRDVWQGR